MKELSTKAAAILEAAQRCETPNAQVRSRVWEQMRLRAAAGDLGPELLEPSTTSSIVSTKVLGWIAAAAVGGGAVVAGVAMLPRDSEPTTSPVAYEAVQPLDEPQTPPQEEPSLVDPSSEPEGASSETPAPPAVIEPTPSKRRAAAKPTTAPPPVTKPDADGLAEEVELMGRARAALARDDAKQALALLEEHAKRFPRGTLAPERDVSRIIALCALGRTERALEHADAFLRRHPRSAMAERVRRTCVGERAARGTAPR